MPLQLTLSVYTSVLRDAFGLLSFGLMALVIFFMHNSLGNWLISYFFLETISSSISKLFIYARIEKSKETEEMKKQKKDDKLLATYMREERKLFLGGDNQGLIILINSSFE